MTKTIVYRTVQVKMPENQTESEKQPEITFMFIITGLDSSKP